MGDTECQVIMPRLKTDLTKLLFAAVKNKLSKINITWDKKKCMTIVLCSRGYPKKYKKNIIIKNLKNVKLNKNSLIYHAGTYYKEKKYLSNGGRVLNITSMGADFLKIRKNIIKIIKKINWNNGFFRKDIGWRII